MRYNQSCSPACSGLGTSVEEVPVDVQLSGGGGSICWRRWKASWGSYFVEAVVFGFSCSAGCRLVRVATVLSKDFLGIVDFCLWGLWAGFLFSGSWGLRVWRDRGVSSVADRRRRWSWFRVSTSFIISGANRCRGGHPGVSRSRSTFRQYRFRHSRMGGADESRLMFWQNKVNNTQSTQEAPHNQSSAEENVREGQYCRHSILCTHAGRPAPTT